jgi:hypothetical protein
VVSKDIRRDPEEPRLGARPTGIELASMRERHLERLSGQFLSRFRSDTSLEVHPDPVVMALEDGQELLPVAQRSDDVLGVRVVRLQPGLPRQA